uniref:Carboxylic ester hydrolase n=1 Tax=Angiostrongylus cantonensis TaxID=6313 RepID=A0A0K0CYP1_ANGCA
LIEGKRYVTRKGFETDCFLGVPFAKPPIGELRFKKPQRLDPWKGVRKCKRFGYRSIQDDMFWDKFVTSTPQSEDCLYLNIFAPAIDPSKSYPVMLYIHGGGFMMDSAVRFKPENVPRLLVRHGVIVVTIQYRLGYLGYFCTGDDVAKGNYGLWDQLEALRWTKENIHHFGGDPNKITVAGQSAGAVSADLLSMSPLSRDMFHRKILMGGSTFCYWATTSKEKAAEYCRQKALKLGWRPAKEESRDLLEFMRKVPAKRLGMHMIGNQVFFNEARLPLAPVIDGEILPKPISQLRAESPPMESISGVGQEESLLFIALGAIRGTEKDMEKVIHELARKTPLKIAEVKELVNRLYGDISELRKDKKAMQKYRFYFQCTSDIFANYGCYRYMMDSRRHDKPTFGYYFGYTSRNMWGWLATRIPFLAGTHSSEIIYLFDCNYFVAPLPMTKTDRKISKLTSQCFMEFVKNGNPNAPNLPFSWESISKSGELRLLKFCEQPIMIEKVSIHVEYPHKGDVQRILFARFISLSIRVY